MGPLNIDQCKYGENMAGGLISSPSSSRRLFSGEAPLLSPPGDVLHGLRCALEKLCSLCVLLLSSVTLLKYHLILPFSSSQALESPLDKAIIFNLFLGFCFLWDIAKTVTD